jgi:hypothetical protein
MLRTAGQVFECMNYTLISNEVAEIGQCRKFFFEMSSQSGIKLLIFNTPGTYDDYGLNVFL